MMNKQRSSVSIRRSDILLAAALLLISAVGLIYLSVFRVEGTTVQITVDGEPYGVYSLTEERTVEIPGGADDAWHNRLIIRDGKAWMESASCPDGICVSHRPIFRDGESIVCLPNRVVVTVTVEDEDPSAPDIIA